MVVITRKAPITFLMRVEQKILPLLFVFAIFSIAVVCFHTSYNEAYYPIERVTATIIAPSSALPNGNTSGCPPQPPQKVDPPPSTDNCLQFDHGDVSPVPNLSSIFNCNSPSGKCQWFYPAKFLHDTCGIGKQFHSTIDYMEHRRIAKELWVNAPPFIIQRFSMHPGIAPNGKPPARTEALPTHNITMVRVHKAGSSSLVKAFQILGFNYTVKGGGRMVSYRPPKSEEAGGKRVKASSTNSTTTARTLRLRLKKTKGTKDSKRPQLTPQEKNERRKDTGEFLDRAVKYRSEWGKTDHTVFAVVRDPAERFISAIGQATGAKGSTKNGIAKRLVDTCVKKTKRETLRCFVDLIMADGTWLEVHFTPMVYEISFGSMYKDIPIAVFPMDELPSLLYELNVEPTLTIKNGKEAGYRVNKILTDLTVDDYDDGTLRDLCKIYEVDILFLQHLGYPSKCDSYRPVDIRCET